MSIEKNLILRCHSKCELCSSDSSLSVYEVPPVTQSNEDKCVMLCQKCLGQIEKQDPMDINHWHCLNESMWSEVSAVQVVAWRLLKRMTDQGWAQDLLEQLYLEEDVLEWACAAGEAENVMPTKDSNGAMLADGDTVTLIKDLDVKGANFTAKRGTVVRKISLTSNPEHIEGRVNGVQIVLLTRYLKKA